MATGSMYKTYIVYEEPWLVLGIQASRVPKNQLNTVLERQA